MTRRARMAGVTLVEILIAMTLLALLAGGVFRAFVFGTRTEVSSGLKSQAVRFAQGTVEDLRLAARRSETPTLDLTNPNDSALSLKAMASGTRPHNTTAWTGSVLATQYGGTRTYTVRTGRIVRTGPEAGQIWWDDKDNGTGLGKDEQGNLITDNNFDVKSVTTTVSYANL